MNNKQVKEYLANLSNKELVEFLSEVLSQRRCDEGLEAEYLQAHWCLADASRMKADDGERWEQWVVELLALHDEEEYPKGWHEQSPLCQGGDCKECGAKLFSWAKKIKCPACGAKAYAT